ncbi:MAG: flagellar biosynthesis protein FlhF, partial [Chloroflexota bacterium]
KPTKFAAPVPGLPRAAARSALAGAKMPAAPGGSEMGATPPVTAQSSRTAAAAYQAPTIAATSATPATPTSGVAASAAPGSGLPSLAGRGAIGDRAAAAATAPTDDAATALPSSVKLESSDLALLRDMKNNMVELKTAMSRLSKQTQFGNIANFSSVLVSLYQRLIDQELAEDLAQDIVLKVNGELGVAGVNNYDLVREYVRKHIQQLVTVTGPPRLTSGRCKSIFLIGPTGVGKTTTLAKLAANYCLVEHKKVALVTVDTFRVAAIPQLRTYADIIGVPLEVVYTSTELKEVIDRLGDKDLVLIDTPGGSPRNSKQLEVLKEYLDGVESKETYLAIASPTKYRDMVEAFERFSIAPIDGLLFTKIDETDRYGALVNLLNHTRARLTYLTTGQNVPNDIELADSVKMADLLLTEQVDG